MDNFQKNQAEITRPSKLAFFFSSLGMMIGTLLKPVEMISSDLKNAAGVITDPTTTVRPALKNKLT